jgi:translation initiation factor IF-3
MRARINGQITAGKVKVISEDGDELGVFSIGEALKLAASRREDLVEIDSEVTPPICQAIDDGKYRYRLHLAKMDRQHE